MYHHQIPRPRAREWFYLFIALNDVIITCGFNIPSTQEGPLPRLCLGEQEEETQPDPLGKKKDRLKLRRGPFKNGSWPPQRKPQEAGGVDGQRGALSGFDLYYYSVQGDLENRTSYS